jgi:hypothetical protein
MNKEYNPDSLDAVLSRLDSRLKTMETSVTAILEKHDRSINKLWAALGRLDVRVAGISAAVALGIVAVKLWLGKG